MGTNINISFEILPEFDNIIWMMTELTLALENAQNSLNLVAGTELYEGKATGEMYSFYEKGMEHIDSLINLYDKAYLFALNAIIDMLEQDATVARILQRVGPW